MTTTIGVKQLHKDLGRIIRRIKRGERILVMKHARPALVITPYEAAELLPQPSKKYYTLDDIRKLQTKGGDKDISKKVDRIVYGV